MRAQLQRISDNLWTEMLGAEVKFYACAQCTNNSLINDIINILCTVLSSITNINSKASRPMVLAYVHSLSNCSETDPLSRGQVPAKIASPMSAFRACLSAGKTNEGLYRHHRCW